MYEYDEDFPWERPNKERLPVLGVVSGTGTSGPYPTEIDFYTRERIRAKFHPKFLTGVVGMRLGEILHKSPSAQVEIAQHAGLRWHVADAVKRGECDLHCLINTDGGFLADYEILKLVFSYLVSRGGTVSTYICDRGFSLGAATWALGDNRSTHKDALAMFHTPMNRVTDSIEANPVYRDAIVQLFSDVPENWKEAAMDWIDPSINPRSEIYCRGEDLETMGISHRTFETQDDLINHVAVQTGIKIDFDPRPSEVAWIAQSAATSLRMRAIGPTRSTVESAT